MSKLSQIQFRVEPSPETNDFEVKIFVDGADFIGTNWPDMMGMDPADVLSLEFLAPREIRHYQTIVRCGCGVVGCGSVALWIEREGDRVTWEWPTQRLEYTSPKSVVFELEQYLQALNAAIADTSWETPERTAARLLKPLVNHDALAAHNLRYHWASNRIREGKFTVALKGPELDRQILVHTSWEQETPHEIAEKVAAKLAVHPSQWADVEWNLLEPPFEGPGWRR
jgi:hypothetical protein